MSGEFLLYQTEDTQTRIQVRLIDGTLWLTQKQLAELYQVRAPIINGHLPLYGRVSEKSNAVRAKLLVLRLFGENSETVSRKSGGIDGGRAIRKFRIVALEAALGLISYLQRRIYS